MGARTTPALTEQDAHIELDKLPCAILKFASHQGSSAGLPDPVSCKNSVAVECHTSMCRTCSHTCVILYREPAELWKYQLHSERDNHFQR